MLKKLYLILCEFGRKLQRDNITAYASSTAFFFFLSIVPLLLIVCSIITYTPLTEQDIIEMIMVVSPKAIEGVIIGFVKQIYSMSQAVLPIAILIAIWSGGKGMMGLQMGLNAVHGVVENRNFFLIRLQACFYTIITLAAILVTFTASIFGRSMLYGIYSLAPKLAPAIKLIVRYRFMASWLIYAIAFTLIYTYLPNVKLKLGYQIPGAIFSAISWVIFSWAFSIYVELSDGMSTYGPLSTIIIVLIWLYSAMFILLIGANLNRYFKPIFKVFIKRIKVGKGDSRQA